MKVSLSWIVLLALAAALTLSTDAGSSGYVAAFYYVWYGDGGRHWNDSACNTVVDTPVVGFYSSMNRSVVEWQLRLMKDIGIDVVIVSWWGPGSYEDNATKLVFEVAREVGIKAAIMVEPWLGNDPSLYNETWWKQVLDYIWNTYAVPHADVYFSWYGKPLLAAFNPIGYQYRPVDERFSTRIVGHMSYVDWLYWSVPPRTSSNGVVSVMPRYDDYYLYLSGARDKYYRYDPHLTEGLYKDQWSYVLQNKDMVRMVIITTWNEYHERTMIEPHWDATAGVDPYHLYHLTKEFVESYRASTIIASIITVTTRSILAGAAESF
ncbi:MAG: hypothetical protein DRO12_03805 [Thermoprotei archaeon]|nr:MAG: hypothetical protein DRO12_03805 [Thermoprotei archaeon]